MSIRFRDRIDKYLSIFSRFAKLCRCTKQLCPKGVLCVVGCIYKIYIFSFGSEILLHLSNNLRYFTVKSLVKIPIKADVDLPLTCGMFCSLDVSKDIPPRKMQFFLPFWI